MCTRTDKASTYLCNTDQFLILHIVRAELVHWVVESGCPFKIVSDHRFQSLMKTGRPGYFMLKSDLSALSDSIGHGLRHGLLVT
jgi:hypothetical protein